MLRSLMSKGLFCGLFLSVWTASEVAAEPLEMFRDCPVCPEMVELPLGAFVMGAPPDEFRRNLVWRADDVPKATPEKPLVTIENGKVAENLAPLRQIKIIPFKDKDKWELCPKYNIGRK